MCPYPDRPVRVAVEIMAKTWHRALHRIDYDQTAVATAKLRAKLKKEIHQW